jgi:hypothetical protein
MILGRLANAYFGIPYVIDYIDPVASDYYWKLPRSQRPPKHVMAYTVGRLTERIAIRHVAQIVGVSKGTTDTAMNRYPWLDRAAATEIPYGGEPTDFDYLRRNPRKNRIFDAGDGLVHVSYVGAYTLSMKPVMAALFEGINRLRHRCPHLFTGLRLHFIGTNYQSETGGVEQVRPIAAEFGIADLVEEHPARVSYLDALNILLQSQALLVVGSVEPHYTASKIFPYILAAKPLLAIFHELSSVVRVLAETKAGQLVTFSDLRPLSEATDEIARRFQNLVESHKGFQRAVLWEAFEPYTTRAMAGRLATVFDKAVGVGPSPTPIRTSALIADRNEG